MPKQSKTILITAGASGGHLFPALAVAEELKKQGYTCVFVVGGSKFAGLVSERGFKLERLPAGAFTNRGPIGLALAGLKLMGGFFKAVQLVMKHKPVAAFGTGGYATVATMLACRLRGVPTMIHEQNVIFGRANKLLCPYVNKVGITFEETLPHLPPKCAPTVLVGTPLREDILNMRKRRREEDGTFHVLILGGSQGARILGEVVPETIAMLSAKDRSRTVIVHQSRPEDVAAVSNAYAQLGLAGYLVQGFFNDLPRRYVDAHLVIGRSGVGTLLEAATLGRAAIYVPHMLADNHQLYNAQVAEAAGAAVVIQQPYFTPTNLLVHIKALLADKTRLAAMEQAARKLAMPDAAKATATAVVNLIVAR